MEDNSSKASSLSDDDDFEDDEEEYEDDEATLDEEESFLKDDEEVGGADELRMLAEDSELSVEELRRKYMGGADFNSGASGNSNPAAGSSTQLRSPDVAGYFTEEALLEEEDEEEYTPPTDAWKKAVRIGPEFQVEALPDFAPTSNSKISSNGPSSAEEPQQIWLPSAKCPQRKIEKYLEECEKMRATVESSEARNGFASFALLHSPPRVPTVEVFDDENALFALLEADYDTEKAKAKGPFPWASIQCVNGPRRTYSEPWSTWSEEECTIFEAALMNYGKNFFAIHENDMPQRTVGELVKFYYSWKRTERYDIFAEKSRQAQQARIENANSIDFMGNIMDMLNGGVRQDGELEVVAMSAQASIITSGGTSSSTKEWLSPSTHKSPSRQDNNNA